MICFIFKKSEPPNKASQTDTGYGCGPVRDRTDMELKDENDIVDILASVDTMYLKKKD